MSRCLLLLSLASLALDGCSKCDPATYNAVCDGTVVEYCGPLGDDSGSLTVTHDCAAEGELCFTVGKEAYCGFDVPCDEATTVYLCSADKRTQLMCAPGGHAKSYLKCTSTTTCVESTDLGGHKTASCQPS
jgi:hypothetical protein